MVRKSYKNKKYRVEALPEVDTLGTKAEAMNVGLPLYPD